MIRSNLRLASVVGAVAITLVVGLWSIPPLLYPPLSASSLAGVADPRARIELQQAQSKLQNEVRTSLLQGLAGILVIVGAAATWRQVQISRDGQITDRFSRAVEHLGSANSDVRIGAIYTLEQVAASSPVDRLPIQYLVAGFVRRHAQWHAGAPDCPTHPDVDMAVPWLYVRAPDVQAAMSVLGRRRPSPRSRRLYLSRTDLRSVNLGGADLTGAQIRYANLARAWLPGVTLNSSDLKGTDLRHANLAGAYLVNSALPGACLMEADLTGADLRGADLRGADLRARNLGAARLDGAHWDATTKWPDGRPPA
ncbi:pentapeptide repeat-containing protein [Actinoplanes sp. NPDC049681]|uniref:pentapeptide repeat-containing protein n=1 Tax=Actinoplanes sp. NPDC049681 TaxID=3363905 RepID=UPI0037A2911A